MKQLLLKAIACTEVINYSNLNRDSDEKSGRTPIFSSTARTTRKTEISIVIASLVRTKSVHEATVRAMKAKGLNGSIEIDQALC